MLSLCGLKVIVNNNLKSGPRLQLSEKFAAMMPPEWVKEQNEWLRNFFGEYTDCFVMGSGTVVMSPEKFAKLRVQLTTQPAQEQGGKE